MSAEIARKYFLSRKIVVNSYQTVTSTIKAFFSASVSIALTATMNLFLNIALDTTPKAPLPTV